MCLLAGVARRGLETAVHVVAMLCAVDVAFDGDEGFVAFDRSTLALAFATPYADRRASQLEAVFQALLPYRARWCAGIGASAWGAVADGFGVVGVATFLGHEHFGINATAGCFFHPVTANLVLPQLVQDVGGVHDVTSMNSFHTETASDTFQAA